MDISDWSLTPNETMSCLSDIASKWVAINNLVKNEKKEVEGKHKDWLLAWKSLCLERFSKIDRDIWEGLKYTLDDDMQPIVVCPTGIANEYKAIGRKPEELVDWMAGMTMSSGLSRLGHVEKYICDRIVDLTIGYFGDETTDISLINGQNLSAAAAMDLYSYAAVLNADGEFVGFKLKSTAKISVYDYVKCSLSTFLSDRNNLIKIEPISNDVNMPCYRYMNTDVKEGDWSTWKSWMDDLFVVNDNKHIFMAWLGSTLDASNTGKQAMWLHGHGNDGKSKVCNALRYFFQNAAVGIGGKSMSNQFGMAKLEGKRLVIMADSKNPKLIQTEWVHNLTGGDNADIERKGKSSYTAPLIGKLLVAANYAPEIKIDEANQTSRLIYVRLKKRTDEDLIAKGMAIKLKDGSVSFIGNNTFPEKLKDEVSSFMAACYKLYLAMAKTRSDIPVSLASKEEMYSICSDPQADNLADLVDSVIEKSSESYIQINNFIEILKTKQDQYGINLNSGFILSDIYSYVYNTYGASRQRRRLSDGSRVNVIVGIKLKQHSNSISKPISNEMAQHMLGVV